MIAYYPRTIDDLRYAVRGRRRVPGFTAAALLMIALGTGANAAMFSVIDAILLRRPFPDSARLALVRWRGPTAASRRRSRRQSCSRR
jgi:hypothetical protein